MEPPNAREPGCHATITARAGPMRGSAEWVQEVGHAHRDVLRRGAAASSRSSGGVGHCMVTADSSNLFPGEWLSVSAVELRRRHTPVAQHSSRAHSAGRGAGLGDSARVRSV
eukprot:TRINITY_DN27920_c0_g1_i1.p1 TRINITY_DN27920_c0_g1~~TRINITY_DN27920_c0_g1_i1.p1  ORF type:complete len:112 (-),score=0.61 TRINITY_DN27920_c0_g1_i1:29-364(-)